MDTPTSEIYTLSLHDALPISHTAERQRLSRAALRVCGATRGKRAPRRRGAARHWRSDDHHNARSEEHTSELQSPCNIVCRLLLDKNKTRVNVNDTIAHELFNR